MIEAYAFLAAFTVQILATSVLSPARFIRYVRGWATRLRLPNASRSCTRVSTTVRSIERFLTRYRAANTVIAVLGLLLLGWFFSYMRRPDWDEGAVDRPVTVYFFLQMLPMVLIGLVAVRFNKVHKRSSPEAKRKAILQRRGLFDFVSPFVVFLAVLSYFLFVAFVIYLDLYVYHNTSLSRHLLDSHRRRHAGLRMEWIHRLHVPVWQKESACDARGSCAHRSVG